MQVHRDVFNGDYEAVSLALDAGTPVDVTDTDEMTPLMVAVSSPASNSQIVQLLLERGANPNASGGELYRPVLGHALLLNVPERVRLLLDAGADITATDEGGTNALMWAIQGRVAHLPEVVELLIKRGAPINDENEDGDSPISIASTRGHFDVVKHLMEAGAHDAPLQWTPLLRAVAMGALNEVQSQLEQGADLSARDHCERTPWLLALAVGDLPSARLLLAAGANRDDVGLCGKTALMISIEADHPEILQWLITEGHDLNAADEFGKTALMQAASFNRFECARLLVDAGADLNKTDHGGQKAINQTQSSEIVRMLIASGQDLNDLTPEIRALMLGLKHEGELMTSLADFEAKWQPQFGTANPEKMEHPFWHAMVKSGATAYEAHRKFVSNDKVFEDTTAPIWSYHRQGKSITYLPDGRFIEIGGSHEDWYDSQFHVYNDVFVHYPTGYFEIYGYPSEVFPPTDFHSVTLVGNFIYIIGCLGYIEQRVIGHTAVYRLNIETLAIEKIETTGNPPGCISMQQGTLINNEIHICGGECTEVFILNLETHQWRRKSN